MPSSSLVAGASACWSCQYGYDDTYSPEIFLHDPSFIYEYKRNMSDSKYAVNSYEATRRKLERFIRSMSNNKSETE